MSMVKVDYYSFVLALSVCSYHAEYCFLVLMEFCYLALFFLPNCKFLFSRKFWYSEKKSSYSSRCNCLWEKKNVNRIMNITILIILLEKKWGRVCTLFFLKYWMHILLLKNLSFMRSGTWRYLLEFDLPFCFLFYTCHNC